MSFTRYLMLGAAVLVALASLYGCDRQTQYAFLTTVFTGVPPMEELYAEKVEEKKLTIEQRMAQMQYKHPLWKTGQCAACHVQAPETVQDEQTDTATAEMMQGVELEAEVIAKATGRQLEPGQSAAVPVIETLPPAEPASAGEPIDGSVAALLMPPDELCISCHLDKTPRRAIRDRLWLHNPVALGECLSCHAPHESANPAHLVQPMGKICLSCHETGQLPEVCTDGLGDNQNSRACLSCHNTHMGKDRFLLTRDYNEVKTLARGVPEPVDSASSNRGHE